MDALASGRPPQRDRLSLGPGRQYGDQCPMGMREGLFAGLISRESHATSISRHRKRDWQATEL